MLPTPPRCHRLFVASACVASVVAALLPRPARAVYWNNDPAPQFGVASATGLTDRVDWFANTHVINNQTNNTRGTTTLLNKEWAITVRHVVQNGGNYGAIAPANQVYVDVLGVRYYADQIFTPDGGTELALVHLRGGVNNALDATGIIQTTGNEVGRYMHVGGYGYWGTINTTGVGGTQPGTASGAVSFHRAYNIATQSGDQLRVTANGEAALETNNLLEGIGGPGDSGGPMFGWYGAGAPTPASSMNDWRLVGLTATANSSTSGSSWGNFSNYTRVSNWDAWIGNTLTSLPAPGPTTTGPWIQRGGTGLYDTGGDKFSVTGSTSAPIVQANFGPGGAGYALDSVGDVLSFSAIVDTPVTMGDVQFRYGMYDDAGGTIPGNVGGGTPWRGYFVGNSVEGQLPKGAYEKGPNGGGVGSWWSLVAPNTANLVGAGTLAAGAYDDGAGNQITPAGRYALALNYTRRASGLEIAWSMETVDAAGAPNGVYSHTGTVLDATPASSNWNYNQLGLFLLGGGFTGTIIVDDINVAFTPATYLAADFNEDGAVDATDLAAWQAGFGTESEATRADGDANNDGAVDGADFLVWQQQLGSLPAPPAALAGAAVPEPATAAMLMLACCSFLASRRHHRLVDQAINPVVERLHRTAHHGDVDQPGVERSQIRNGLDEVWIVVRQAAHAAGPRRVFEVRQIRVLSVDGIGKGHLQDRRVRPVVANSWVVGGTDSG